MTPTQARESRRKAIEGITSALWTMSQDGSYLRSIKACEAMAQAHQLLGRLWAIDEQEAYSEAIANGKPARFPRPSVIPDVPEFTHEQEADGAFRLAWEAAFMTGDPNELDDMGEAWDRGDDGVIRAVVNAVKLNGRP